MASRNFNRQQALEKEIKQLHVKVTTDAGGAVTAIDGLGIATVEETAADTYTITLEDKYSFFKGASVLPGVSSSFNIASEDVASAKTIVLEFAVSQASVDFYVTLHLKNTSLTR